MIAPRRTLLLVASLALGGLPACLTVCKKLPPKEPPTPVLPLPEPPTKTSVSSTSTFAELPKMMRPGERIPRHPDAVAKTTPDGTPAKDIVAPPAPDSTAVIPANQTQRPLPIIDTVVIDPPLIAALRAFLENDPTRAVDALKYLDKPNQEIILAAMPALVRAAQMNMQQADPQEVGVISDQFHAAGESVESRAALSVERLTFCRKVTGFGRYDPWPAEQAYQPNDLAELYLEIRHLRSQPTGPGDEGYMTHLVSSLEIRDAAGHLVDQTDPADWQRRVPMARFERKDFSRSPVRDYFLKYRFPVPTVPGTYTVTIEVRDVASSRTTRSRPLEFRVGP